MRILVVEDEPKIASAIKRGLEAEAFSVDVVEDGDSGLSYGQSDEYDMIILDWMLPGNYDGKQVCEELRKHGIKTPILMLTARDTVDAKVAGLNGGADDYLAKPFSFDVLLARIRALLRRPHQSLGEVLEIGDLILNPALKSVTRAGHDIRLTSKEYAILEYLMRNPGRVISKDSIISHVWDFDADVLPNNVEVFITFLRSKIDKPFKTPLLHTVRGFGYKVSVDA